MYTYHALVNTLSAHMIHINLNMIFYTHVESIVLLKQFTLSIIKNKIKKYTLQIHTHTHTHTHIVYCQFIM